MAKKPDTMTEDEARQFVKKLKLYESRVDLQRGSTKVSGIVEEMGDFNGRCGVMIEGSREVYYLSGVDGWQAKNRLPKQGRRDKVG